MLTLELDILKAKSSTLVTKPWPRQGGASHGFLPLYSSGFVFVVSVLRLRLEVQENFELCLKYPCWLLLVPIDAYKNMDCRLSKTSGHKRLAVQNFRRGCVTILCSRSKEPNNIKFPPQDPGPTYSDGFDQAVHKHTIAVDAFSKSQNSKLYTEYQATFASTAQSSSDTDTPSGVRKLSAPSTPSEGKKGRSSKYKPPSVWVLLYRNRTNHHLHQEIPSLSILLCSLVVNPSLYMSLAELDTARSLFASDRDCVASRNKTTPSLRQQRRGMARRCPRCLKIGHQALPPELFRLI